LLMEDLLSAVKSRKRKRQLSEVEGEELPLISA